MKLFSSKLAYTGMLIFYCSIFHVSGQKIFITDMNNYWLGSRGAYTYSGTTERNGQIYNQLITIPQNDFQDTLLLREDTVAKKVYARSYKTWVGFHITDTSEFLLFDYNLQAGDSLFLPICLHCTEDTTNPAIGRIHRVTNVDTTFINDRWYKYFSITAEDPEIPAISFPYVLIEGIGSLWGPALLNTSENAVELRCFKNNGVSPISDLFGSHFSQCTLGISKESLSTNNWSAYPNPASQKLTIILNQVSNSGFHLLILNISGRCFYQSKIQGKEVVDISTWPSGLYMVQIIDDKGGRSEQKISVINS